jgi:restriction endonuclease
MSNSTEALYHCAFPAGVEIALPGYDPTLFNTPVSAEVHQEFYRRFNAACVAYTKAKGIAVKTIKAEEFKVTNGPSIFVIAAGSIDAAYFAKGWPSTEEESVISIGMTIRTVEALNAHSYSAEREDFSIYTAVDQTIKAGKRFVIVEDLS